jgi:hypothetical protein
MVMNHLFSLGFGSQNGLSLAHAKLVVVSEGFRMLQDVLGSAVNGHAVYALLFYRTTLRAIIGQSKTIRQRKTALG